MTVWTLLLAIGVAGLAGWTVALGLAMAVEAWRGRQR